MSIFHIFIIVFFLFPLTLLDLVLSKAIASGTDAEGIAASFDAR